MKMLFALVLTAISLSAMAAPKYSVKCEMTDIKNKKNKITAIAKVVDDYGMAETPNMIDDKYGFMVEIQADDNDLNVTIYDENDEVGSMSCKVDGKGKKGQTICKEPIEDESGEHKYDLVCKYN